eukprot:CAMPEP_0114568820 /NCGR_PEP_ID=MMETSP0114-20121206/16270_1 /TAXON_ID=31324 /ORGANISM="Goniomonas sp, Strain m" /LENGTH=107 /DNA_ID=CAMNT_0001755605 /DNA_START=85 /DNA_END=404 /DNA_ORIENTATION=+
MDTVHPCPIRNLNSAGINSSRASCSTSDFWNRKNNLNCSFENLSRWKDPSQRCDHLSCGPPQGPGATACTGTLRNPGYCQPAHRHGCASGEVLPLNMAPTCSQTRTA